MSRALSVKNVLMARSNELMFEGVWLDACGYPEHGGQTWFIYGDSKMGKTTFAMQMGKMLAQHGLVAYDSIEEGLSKSIREAYQRVGMDEVDGRFWLYDKEEIESLKNKLCKRKSPEFVFIDSVQFAELTFTQYKQLKLLFPEKNFVYISHVGGGRRPDGTVAQRILRDASISFYVEGFKAFPTSRFGGNNEPIIINQERADAYWGLKNLLK